MMDINQCASSYEWVSFEQIASTRKSLTLASLLLALILGPYKASTQGTSVNAAPCLQLVEFPLDNGPNLQVLQVDWRLQDIPCC
jgi:hypothetical protein